jgi:hypothetical protein
MGTRASIKFTDGHETFFVYRGHDGFPEVVRPDIEKALLKHEQNVFHAPECGLLVATFFGVNYKPEQRLQDYEMTTSVHGDESYRYEIAWHEQSRSWIIKGDQG